MNNAEDLRIREQAAHKRYRSDARFAALVQGIVAQVLQEHGPVDPVSADRDAYRIATRVAAVVLETVFTEDAELRAQRDLADRYKKIAEDAVYLAPPPFFAPKQDR